jgi:hypothetical protein
MREITKEYHGKNLPGKPISEMELQLSIILGGTIIITAQGWCGGLFLYHFV